MDYEAEYSVRARVPEHAAINQDWALRAEAYRTRLVHEGRAALGLAYGPGPCQFVDIFSPVAAAGRAPLALFVHGGCWRGQDPRKFSHLAAGLNACGVRVALVGYDLCPQVRIAGIIEEVRRACLFLFARHGERIVVFGHSAGGHLAAFMLATRWREIEPRAPAALVPAAYAISGVFDLVPLLATSINADLRLDAEEARAASPLFAAPPVGLVFDAVVGGEESSEFRRQSREMAREWEKAGVRARCEEVAGANHFTVLEPLGDARSAMTERLADLCRRA